jgi:hypothetical protein
MLYQLSYTPASVSISDCYSSYYRVSLCGMCLLQRGQYFLYSTRSGWSRLFFLVV